MFTDWQNVTVANDIALKNKPYFVMLQHLDEIAAPRNNC